MYLLVFRSIAPSEYRRDGWRSGSRILEVVLNFYIRAKSPTLLAPCAPRTDIYTPSRPHCIHLYRSLRVD
jgi:hypothetical protein